MINLIRAASLAAVLISAAGTVIVSDPGFALSTEEPAIVAPVDTASSASAIANADIDPSDQNSSPALLAPAPAPAIVPIPRPTAATLSDLVRAMPQPEAVDEELMCLAGTIYFEAKGESLAGQLAVGRVVINRANSGRFPRSLCGVVYQRSQFSFVRGGTMPAIDKRGQAWRNALAIAQIARDDLWENPVGNALFFHAARVSPGWRLTRVAQVDNHIFYR